MCKNKKIITVGGLVVLLALSFLMFFGLNTSKKTGIEISSFIFVLLTEIIIFSNVFFLTEKKFNNTFTIAGLTSLTFIYSVISLVVNVLLVGMFSVLRTNLIFNFSLLLIYIFIALMVFFFKKEYK